MPGFEDIWYYLWRERRLPVNVDPFKSNLKDEQERARLSRVFEQGLDKVVGYALPLTREWTVNGAKRWRSGVWFLRPQAMYLLPGDSPMGLRLPLDSLPGWWPRIIPAATCPTRWWRVRRCRRCQDHNRGRSGRMWLSLGRRRWRRIAA